MTNPVRRPHSITHVVNVSGGKDSDCAYLLAVERGRPFRAVFADTGNEHDWTYDHVRQLGARTGGPEVEWVKADFTDALARRRARLPDQWRAAGVSEPLIDQALALLHPTGVPYLDLVLSKGMFAAGARRKFCTEYLKVLPVDQQVIRPLADARSSIVQWLGIRSDESAARADAEKHPRLSRMRLIGGGHLAYYRPLLDWDLARVVAFHDRHGLPMNPLYAHGMERVGCFPCINERKAGIAIIARWFPEHIARLREWERIVTLVNVSRRKVESFDDICTFFPAGKVSRMKRNTIDDVVDWSFTRRNGEADPEAGNLRDLGRIACTSGMGWCEA